MCSVLVGRQIERFLGKNMHHQQREAKSTAAAAAGVPLLAAGLLLFLLFGVISSLTEARYLPTRADESEVEILKELIRGLMAQSQVEQLETKLGRLQQQQQQLQQHPNRHASNDRLYPQATFRVERRSVELPQTSEGDSLLRQSIGPVEPVGFLTGAKLTKLPDGGKR